MRIMLDGPDCVGKSTITEKLANSIGCNIVRLTYNGDRSLRAYYQMMAVDNVIHDRSFISEIIYPKYFGRACRLDFDDEKYLHNMIDNLSIKVIILTASPETLEKRMRSRGDEHINNIDKLVKINHDYLEYAREHDIPVINVTNKTIDEIIKEIGGYLV